MSKQTQGGLIPPRAAARIDFNPPLNLDEVQATLLTITGTDSIKMQVEPACVYLTNMTDKHAPFLLIITPKTMVSFEAFFTNLFNRIGGSS